MIAALVIAGAPGSGKTSALTALGARLEAEGCEYSAFESEQLAQGSPLLAASDWIPQLAAVLTLQRQVGRRLFLIAVTPESASDLEGVVAATGADMVLVVCLKAPAEILANRVRDREPDSWPGKQPLIAHTRDLATLIPTLPNIDLTIDTEHRNPTAIADDLFTALASHQMITRP